MNRSEEVPHLRSNFRQSDDAGKLKLVARLRDIAIEYLQPVMARVPRAMSSDAKAAYQAKGISLEWDLTTTDAYEFSSMACGAGLSKSQQSAAALLDLCTQALENDALPDHLRDCILDAYAGLDLDAVATGEKFGKGRKPNTGGPIRRAIAGLLKKSPAMKNLALWAALKAKPPRGWTFRENRQGRYIDAPKAGGGMEYARFCNVASEERKKLKR